MVTALSNQNNFSAGDGKIRAGNGQLCGLHRRCLGLNRLRNSQSRQRLSLTAHIGKQEPEEQKSHCQKQKRNDDYQHNHQNHVGPGALRILAVVLILRIRIIIVAVFLFCFLFCFLFFVIILILVKVKNLLIPLHRLLGGLLLLRLTENFHLAEEIILLNRGILRKSQTAGCTADGTFFFKFRKNCTAKLANHFIHSDSS